MNGYTGINEEFTDDQFSDRVFKSQITIQQEFSIERFFEMSEEIRELK